MVKHDLTLGRTTMQTNDYSGGDAAAADGDDWAPSLSCP